MSDNTLTEIAIRALSRLKNWQMTICAAESCTGGLFLSTLTDIPGSSACVMGGVVTYSNEAKQNLVHVPESTLIAHGAVSEQTAAAMATGAQALFKTDVAISVTGIAGPGGGTPEKPVGLVYIGIKVGDKEPQVERFIWEGDRQHNKQESVKAALKMVFRELED